MTDEMEMTTAFLQEAIANKDVTAIRTAFDEHQVVDMTELAEGLSLQDMLFLFKILTKDVSAQVFTYLSQDTKEALIQAFTGPQIKEMLENIYADDIVEFMNDLPANLSKKILQAATPQTREEINQLLSYQENSCGSIMSTDFVELKERDTVEQAIAKIKRQGKMAETINVCFVIDGTRQLVGTILLKEFLFENRDLSIQDIMDTDIEAVRTDDDQEVAADIIQKYDITVVPVVNNEQKLIGIITVDDIMDVMEEEVTEDIHKMAAVNPLEDTYRDASVWELVRSRLPWLLILMISGTFTSTIISGYESQLLLIPALSGFVPMLMGTAGNAGSQASTMVIRGMAVDDLRFKDIFRVIGKELCVSVLCGAVLFAVNYIRIACFPSSLVSGYGAVSIALVVSASVALALCAGKIIGGILPLIVSLFHLDPAAVAAPVITTIVDALSLIIYFQTAVYFLGI